MVRWGWNQRLFILSFVAFSSFDSSWQEHDRLNCSDEKRWSIVDDLLRRQWSLRLSMSITSEWRSDEDSPPHSRSIRCTKWWCHSFDRCHFWSTIIDRSVDQQSTKPPSSSTSDTNDRFSHHNRFWTFEPEEFRFRGCLIDLLTCFIVEFDDDHPCSWTESIRQGKRVSHDSLIDTTDHHQSLHRTTNIRSSPHSRSTQSTDSTNNRKTKQHHNFFSFTDFLFEDSGDRQTRPSRRTNQIEERPNSSWSMDNTSPLISAFHIESDHCKPNRWMIFIDLFFLIWGDRWIQSTSNDSSGSWFDLLRRLSSLHCQLIRSSFVHFSFGLVLQGMKLKQRIETIVASLMIDFTRHLNINQTISFQTSAREHRMRNQTIESIRSERVNFSGGASISYSSSLFDHHDRPSTILLQVCAWWSWRRRERDRRNAPTLRLVFVDTIGTQRCVVRLDSNESFTSDVVRCDRWTSESDQNQCKSKRDDRIHHSTWSKDDGRTDDTTKHHWNQSQTQSIVFLLFPHRISTKSGFR